MQGCFIITAQVLDILWLLLNLGVLKDINLQNKTNTAIKSLYKSLKAPHNDPLKTHHEEMYLKKKKGSKNRE